MRSIVHSAARIPLAALLAVIATGCVEISAGDARYTDTIEKRFAVTGATSLHLGTFDGSVEVSTWDRPEVLVLIEKRALNKSAADRMQVTAEQDGNEITVDVRRANDGGMHLNFGPDSARITITTPVETRIDVATGDGRVTVRDVRGDIEARTGDGAIRLENVSGAVDARSGDGSIEVDGAIGRLRANSGDGRLRIHTRASAPSGDWDLSTGDGAVVLEVPDGFGAELDVETGDGRVSVRDVSFSSSGDSRDRRSARGRIGSGGPRITIRSGDGSITVRGADSGN